MSRNSSWWAVSVAALSEAVERPLGGGAIEPDQRTHEEAEAAFGADALEILRRCRRRLRRRCARARLDRSVSAAHSGAASGSRYGFGCALRNCRALARNRSISVPTGTPATSIARPRPDLILEVAVDDRPPLELDQLDEGAKPAAHRLQHRRRDVLPVFVGLQLQDQRQAPPPPSACSAALRAGRRCSTIFFCKAGEPMAAAQKRKLRAKDQEIELLGVEVVVDQAGRQARRLR